MAENRSRGPSSLKAKDVAVIETVVNEVDEVTPLLGSKSTSYKVDTVQCRDHSILTRWYRRISGM